MKKIAHLLLVGMLAPVLMFQSGESIAASHSHSKVYCHKGVCHHYKYKKHHHKNKYHKKNKYYKQHSIKIN